jgi:hypothetical protein
MLVFSSYSSESINKSGEKANMMLSKIHYRIIIIIIVKLAYNEKTAAIG